MDDAAAVRRFRYFLTVASELHFRRAAERLGIAQPTLSVEIRKLEEALGCALFDRTRRRVRLTEAGTVLRDRAPVALESLASALEDTRRAAAGQIGKLTIAYSGSVMFTTVPAILRDFRLRYLQVAVDFVEILSRDQGDALKRHRVDVTMGRDPDPELGIQLTTLANEPLLLALPKRHPLAVRAVIGLEQMAQDRLVLFRSSAHPTLHRRILGLFAPARQAPQVVQETSAWLTTIPLVETGFGYSIVPGSFHRLQSEGVVYRSIRRNPRTTVALGYRRGDPSQLVRNFLECAERITRKRDA
jgi:DNA-binding transcriptional LysR family regulator